MTKTSTLILLCCAAIAGCSDTGLSPTSLTFGESAEASIIPGGLETIYATMEITNTSTVPQTLSWGVDCLGDGALEVRAYRTTGSALVLAWDSDKLPRTVGCATQLVQRTLNPGDVAFLHESIPAAIILGDSLPAGLYGVTIKSKTTPAIDAEIAAANLTIINAVVDPPGGNLNGTWNGSTHGVTVTLALAWTADSVKGSGQYVASTENTLGCGGGTLQGSGTVTYAASRGSSQFVGPMVFSGGWTPPFIGILADASTIGGEFMSVDTGPCPLTLKRVTTQ